MKIMELVSERLVQGAKKKILKNNISGKKDFKRW